MSMISSSTAAAVVTAHREAIWEGERRKQPQTMPVPTASTRNHHLRRLLILLHRHLQPPPPSRQIGRQSGKERGGSKHRPRG
ncbi:hypothetical protein PAHAL_5G299500 [Panicum hallii]|uniref:Uncharacterized protein n=2 Tax=Panicum hallii TaxID=206008 RepID=A0A2T8ILQ2_9POAL|nr:hypothetical protein PAHAL_5G299500 [Panicum hallii]